MQVARQKLELPDAAGAAPPEIAFLSRYGVPLDTLDRAGQAAWTLGVPSEAVLLAEGVVSEEFFYRALADHLGAPYHVGPAPFDPAVAATQAFGAGIVYLAPLAAPYRAICAPTGRSLGLLVAARGQGRPIEGLAIAAPRRLSALVRRERGAEVARTAALSLWRDDPSFSARSLSPVAETIGLAALVTAASAAAWAAPGWTRAGGSLALWGLFSACVFLRSAATIAAGAAPPASPLADADLPVYSVIIALYREAEVAPKLVAALNALDYPRAKLDIKLAIEADDRETAAALVALDLPPRFELVIAPPGKPRTKPRALNVALETVRGELVCVYDAEDEPAPDQLRKAAARFATDRRVDALQGRLTIANAHDGWISFLFAVEYAALFDLVNPGLCALDLPIALGGTTNHFRTAALRRVGGWDAWNVAEDADLGVRLARFGMRVGMLDSDTLEEAPNEFGNWFRQRVRWQKGWMQTGLVHLQDPRRFFRELGLRRGLAAFVLIVGGVATGLAGPPFLAAALWRWISEAAGETPASRLADVYTYILTLTGLQVTLLPALIAMRRRGLRPYSRAVFGLPVYYLLVTAATWVALYELLRRPFHWHKTAHGRSEGALPPPGRSPSLAHGRSGP